MNNEFLEPNTKGNMPEDEGNNQEDNISVEATCEELIPENSRSATDEVLSSADASKDAEADTPCEAPQSNTCEEPVQVTTPVFVTPPYSNPTANTTPPYSAPQSPYEADSVYSSNNAPVPQPKRSKGKTAFLICLWVLVGIFALGFFVMCGYIAGLNSNEGSTAPTLFTVPDVTELPTEKPEDVTSPQDNNENNNAVILPDDDDDDVYSEDDAIELHNIPEDNSNTSKYTTKYAYNKVLDSTVGVVCYKDSFTDEPDSQGTGIIISDNGYIVTNSHVIGDSRTAYNVQVITNDQTSYEAKIIGYDSRTDLAVLKIDATDLPEAEFCDSSLVEVGDDVIAVGNPGGIEFQNSLTKGVVSALDRELDLTANVSYIQTDAAINPGNSGGPLCNIYGQVIGVNTAKISSSSYEGMGFAIPSRTIKEIVDDLMAQGYVSGRVRLGISGTAVTSTMQQYYNTPQGILVGEIAEDGPCDGSGLKINDIITAIDGEKVTSFSDVYGILSEHKAGDKVELSVYRLNSDTTLEIEIILMADEGETQQ